MKRIEWESVVINNTTERYNSFAARWENMPTLLIKVKLQMKKVYYDIKLLIKNYHKQWIRINYN